MDRDLKARLDQIEAKLDALLVDAGLVESLKCGFCGSDRLEDTSTPAGPRITCLSCGKSAAPNQEAANG